MRPSAGMANSAKAPDQLSDATFLALDLAQNLVDTAMKCAQLLTTGVFTNPGGAVKALMTIYNLSQEQANVLLSSAGGGFLVDIFNQGMQSSIGWLSGIPGLPLSQPRLEVDISPDRPYRTRGTFSKSFVRFRPVLCDKTTLMAKSCVVFRLFPGSKSKPNG